MSGCASNPPLICCDKKSCQKVLTKKVVMCMIEMTRKVVIETWEEHHAVIQSFEGIPGKAECEPA